MVNRDEINSQIDAVDWTTLSHAYGAATDTPDHLRKLLSEDEKEREGAYASLCASVYHQGSRYNASAPTAKILTAIIAAPDAPNRVKLIALLTYLAIGDPSHRWMRGVAIDEWRADIIHMDEPDFDDNLVKERAAWVAEATTELERKQRERRLILFSTAEELRTDGRNELAAYDAVKAQIPTLLNLLHDPNPAIRIETAYNLSWFSESLETISQAYFDLLSRENDEVVSATVVIALGQLSLNGNKDYAKSHVIPVVASIFSNTSSGRFLKWSSAVAIVLLKAAGTEHFDEVLKILVDSNYLDSLVNMDVHINGFPFADPDFTSLAAMVLRDVEDDVAKAKIIDALIEGIPQTKGETTVVLTQMGLHATFPLSDEKVEASSLTDVQRRLVRALTQVDPFMFSFANFLRLLRPRGLPSDPVALQVLAREEPDAAPPSTSS